VSSHGRVTNGTSAADCLPDELERKITIHTKTFHCQWEGHRITLLDTPGFAAGGVADNGHGTNLGGIN
jgi:elongation factor G